MEIRRVVRNHCVIAGAIANVRAVGVMIYVCKRKIGVGVKG